MQSAILETMSMFTFKAIRKNFKERFRGRRFQKAVYVITGAKMVFFIA